MRVRLFASLRELAGAPEVEVGATDAASVATLLSALSTRLGPRFDQMMAAGSVVVNGEPAPRDRLLDERDEVALLPPVSGGAHMDIGIGLPNPIHGTHGRTLIEWSTRAESRGFSSLATIDRLAYPSYESLTVLAAAAAVTDRIGLLTNILLGPARTAVLLAKESASVDQLSAGRLTLGLGVGSSEDDYELAGVDFGGRGRKWDQDLETIHRVWRGEPAESNERPIGPAPVREGLVPMLFGGRSDRTIARILQWGVGWTSGSAPPERAAPFADRVRAAWAQAGREGAPRVVALTYFALGDGADAGARAYLDDYYGASGQALAAITPTTPDALRERIERFRTLGFDEVILDPTIAALEQVDAAAEVAFG